MSSTTTRQYTTVLTQAKKGVPGFALAYGKFIEKTTLEQNSKGLITNYSRSLAYIALHFSRVPHLISVEQINAYLYQMMVHENCSLSYFKHAVFALRYWFRLFGMEDKAIQMPPIFCAVVGVEASICAYPTNNTNVKASNFLNRFLN